MISSIKRLIKYKKKLRIIMDFDYTITDFASYSSIGVFSNYLCEEYISKKIKIDNIVNKLNDEQIDDYHYCWKQKIALLKQHVENKKIIKKIVSDNNFNVRKEIISIINYANKNNIPIIILSSGCGEVIEEILKKNNIFLNNITITANYIFKDNLKLVTPANKKEFLDDEYINHIVFGDDKKDFIINQNVHNVFYSIDKIKNNSYSQVIVDNNYRILSEYTNKKCTYGEALYKGKKVFYKNIKDGVKKEIRGYNLVKLYYDVPKIITYDNKIILYEFISDLINKTMHEYLYTYDYLKFDFNIILNQYMNSLKNIKYLNENKLNNSKFYKNRISQVENYISSNICEENNDIFNEIIEKIKLNKRLYSFISQGDPTDTNISITGKFSDFENGGYNSLVGEISIFIVSLLTHGAYYYPKYNKKAYEIRPVMPNKINISNKNINLLIKYLLFFKNNLNKEEINELDKYLIYYICFRLLTPMNLIDMNKKDRNNILKVINLFYKTKDFDDILLLIKKWNIDIIRN